MLYHGTDIDGPTFDPDALNVRGKDLNDLITKSTYVDALYHIMAGRMPARDQRQRFETFLLRTPALVPPDHPMLQVTRITARSGVPPSRSMSAGLMVEAGEILTQIRTEIRLDEFGPALEEVLFAFALAPLLLSTALHPQAVDPAAPFRRQGDYLGAMHAAAGGRDLGDGASRKMFDAVMIAFHGGFGVLPPTVQIPRSSIGTGAPIAQAIAAGYATAGPNHAGACEEAMKVFQRLATETGDLRERVERFVDGELAAGRVIYGFGHPVFVSDPRTSVIRAMADQTGLVSPYLAIYDEMRRVAYDRLQVHSNLDSISATIYSSVGISPPGGTGLFLCSRTAAMIAHAIERPATKPAFGLKSRITRKILKDTPKETFEFTPY
jgi:citrate synthase